MENKKFKKLALMGLAGGLLCVGAEANAVESSSNQVKDLLGNVSLNGSYGSLLAANCGGQGGGGGSGCGQTSNQQGQLVSQGCAGKQIGGNPGDSNSANPQLMNQEIQSGQPQARQINQGCQSGYPNQQNSMGANQQNSMGANQGCGGTPQRHHTLSQGCGGRPAQPTASHGCGSASRQQYTAQGSCGASRSSQGNNNNNGHYYADGQQESQNQMNDGMAPQDYSNSKQLAENELRNNPRLSDPRMGKDVMSQLSSPQAKAQYQSLTPEGKALAAKLINQECKGKNDCKGQGSCKNSENSCAGKNGCKGKSPGPFKDKNTAIKVAAEKMAEKRNNVLNRSMSH